MPLCSFCSRQAEKSFQRKDGVQIYKTTCRTCRGRNESQEMRERKRQISKEYRKLNPEKTKESSKRWRLANKEKVKELNCKNKEKRRLYSKNRLSKDINFRLTKYLRSRLYSAIKNNQKLGSAVSDLGCTIEELRFYLEKSFTSLMTWDNYGDWHIDHVRPLASFDLTNPKQFKEACHYTNLQPLWAEDNFKKSDNWEKEE